MPPTVSVALLVAVVVLVLWAMRRAWLARVARTAAVVPVLPGEPAGGWGEPRTGPVDAVYVSTTTAGDWLDRVAAHDLGVRSAAVAQVFDGGLRVTRTGARDVLVPASALRGAGTSPGMAGKFVGGEGLVVVTWQAPTGPDGSAGALLDTGLRTHRAEDREVLLEALRGLLPPTGRAGAADESTVGHPAGGAPQQNEEGES